MNSMFHPRFRDVEDKSILFGLKVHKCTIKEKIFKKCGHHEFVYGSFNRDPKCAACNVRQAFDEDDRIERRSDAEERVFRCKPLSQQIILDKKCRKCCLEVHEVKSLAQFKKGRNVPKLL